RNHTESYRETTRKGGLDVDFRWTLGGVMVELWWSYGNLTRTLREILLNELQKKKGVSLQNQEPTLIYEKRRGFARRVISFHFGKHRNKKKDFTKLSKLRKVFPL
ncbi:MAG TPA: hypothetical protein VGD22_06380, partial [Sphingobacteriaceae bacterium]